MTNNLKSSIYSMIDTIKDAEKITKATLATLSRDMLMYIPDSHDIAALNRLIEVLTPMNRSLAILYFAHFLEWEKEKDSNGNFVRFGAMMKGDKKIKRKADVRAEWLKIDANDIWVWGKDNVEIKQKDFIGMLSNAIKRVMKDDEKSGTAALTERQVIDVFFNSGISIDAFVEGLETAQERQKAEQEEAEKVMGDSRNQDIPEAA